MTGWLIGRGIADITGEPWGVGMMGYGMPHQRTNGIRTRQFARAFLLDDGRRRVAFVVADVGMFFQAGVDAIHERLAQKYGDTYGPGNVVLTATHTHCGPGGHGHDMLYNVTTVGHHRRTFSRLVDGVVDAIGRAEADLAPTTAVLNRGELHDASANRARAAFERNPAAERAEFPDGVDPATTLLRFERDGDLVGAINWFGVHNTSMPNTNRLISSDNKGWAAYLWEQEVDGLVAGFAQTNAGDQSPNLDLLPGRGPTDDSEQNTEIIGQRQLGAAKALASQAGDSLEPVIDVRHRYLRVAEVPTADGRTGRAILGASFAAGKMTDGPGSPLFREGKRNPVPERLSKAFYRLSPALAASQRPKDLFLPIGRMRWGQETYLLQLIRCGSLYLVCLPFEVTIVSGLRIRRAVAAELGVPVSAVLLQGYANGYGHYVTTPEEYDEQLYEGGSTIFGREELPALQEACVSLATAMRDGVDVPPGEPPKPHRLRLTSPVGSPRFARSQPVALVSAPSRAAVSDEVTARFATGHPNADMPASYFVVERQQDDGWVEVADDASLNTAIEWSRDRAMRFSAEVRWTPTEPGTYRVRYQAGGEARTFPIEIGAEARNT